jgi:hypothetical protein
LEWRASLNAAAPASDERSVVKSLVLLGAVSVSGLLSAASAAENARWVNQYP